MPQPVTRLRYKTTDKCICSVFTVQLSLVLRAPTHGWMAGLSLPGWVDTYWNTLIAHNESPLPVISSQWQIKSNHIDWKQLITMKNLTESNTDSKSPVFDSVSGSWQDDNSADFVTSPVTGTCFRASFSSPGEHQQWQITTHSHNVNQLLKKLWYITRKKLQTVSVIASIMSVVFHLSK